MNRTDLINFAEENDIHAQVKAFDHGEEVWLSCDYEEIKGLGENDETIGLWKKRISLLKCENNLWEIHFLQVGKTKKLIGLKVKEFVLKWKHSDRGDFSYADEYTNS